MRSRKIQNVTALLLAFALSLSLSIPALAASEYGGAINLSYSMPEAGSGIQSFAVSSDCTDVSKVFVLDNATGVLFVPSGSGLTAYGQDQSTGDWNPVSVGDTTFAAGHSYLAYVTLAKSGVTFTGAEMEPSRYDGTVSVNGAAAESAVLRKADMTEDNFRSTVSVTGPCEYLRVAFSFVPSAVPEPFSSDIAIAYTTPESGVPDASCFSGIGDFTVSSVAADNGRIVLRLSKTGFVFAAGQASAAPYPYAGNVSVSGSDGQADAFVEDDGRTLRIEFTPVAAAAGPRFSTVHMTVSEDLSLVFNAVDVSGYDSYRVVFTRERADGNLTAPTCVSVAPDRDGTLAATFFGISPQLMMDTVTARLEGRKGESEWEELCTKACSVRDYCNSLCQKAADLYPEEPEKLAATRTLLADLLSYGAAAQNYTGYNTGKPANGSFAGTASVFSAPDSTLFVKPEKNYPEYESLHFSSVTLLLDNVNSIMFSVVLNASVKDSACLSIQTGSGEEIRYSVADMTCTDAEKGVYRLTTLPLKLSQNATKVTARLYPTRESTTPVQTVDYSVDSYVYAKHSSDTVGDIVQRLYCLGKSATAYRDAFRGDNA